MKKVLISYFICLLLASQALSIEIYENNDFSLNLGWWGQFWYQYVSDFPSGGQDKEDDFDDFLIRRSYFYIDAKVSEKLSFFTNIASDKLGMENIDNDSDKGLGSGIAIRDAWIAYKILDNDIIIQAGRMYVPFTRNYGTTSTKSFLTTDLNWGQAGLRSNIFYPSNVGRDDSVTIWGNVIEDKFQYRFMLGEGEENDTKNPDNTYRFAGRLSYNFFDTETSWFNSGNYLGKKYILSVGTGIDYQKDLFVGGVKDDYFGWTADLHYDRPLKNGDSLVVVASYIYVTHNPNGITGTGLRAGDDGHLASVKAGYFFNRKIGFGNLQPFAHLQNIGSKQGGNNDTYIYSLG